MAVGLLIENPGLTTERYDAVNEQMDIEGNPPAGLIFHCAWAVDGGLSIFDVWESKDAYDRFAQERLGPAIEAISGGPPQGEPPSETVYELHDYVKV